MSNPTNKRQRDALDARRRRWLTAHGQVLPSADEDVTAEQSRALDAAFTAMQTAGLYAKTSDRYCSKWGIRKLLSRMRGRPVELHRRYELLR